MPFLQSRSNPPGMQAPQATLYDPEPGRRRQAIRNLAAQGAAARVLADHLANEADPSVRHTLLSALAVHPDLAAERALAGYLRSDDAALRNGAADALALNITRRQRLATSMLLDDDADSRLTALALFGDTDLVTRADRGSVRVSLLDLLETEADVNVCGAALGLLDHVADETCLAPLKRLQQRFADDPYIQFATALVIKRFDKEKPR